MSRFSSFWGLMLLLMCSYKSYGQENTPEAMKMPAPCYEALLKLEPVAEDTTLNDVPYQTYLFRHQREWLVVVSDTASYYSFTFKRIKVKKAKIDTLMPNSVAFDMNICKLFDPKKLNLKKRKKVLGDLRATHYYTFARSLQRLYVAMRAAETGNSPTFIEKSWAEIKQIPKVLAFLKAKPNDKLLEKMAKMKKDITKTATDAKKMQEALKKAEAERKALAEEVKKLKAEREAAEARDKKALEEREAKEKEKAKQDSIQKAQKTPPANAKKTGKDGKDNGNANTAKVGKNEPTKNPPADSTKTKILPTDTTKKDNTSPVVKGKDGKDSIIVVLPTKTMTKKDSLIAEMNRVLQEIQKMKDIEQLRKAQDELMKQKYEMENPGDKRKELPVIDVEKRKNDMRQKIAEVNMLLDDLAKEKEPAIVQKRQELAAKRDQLLAELKKLENPQ